jgi:hypothetical protein
MNLAIFFPNLTFLTHSSPSGATYERIAQVHIT